MKKINSQKLALSTNTVRKLSQELSDKQLVEVGGASVTCLPLTRVYGGCQ